MYFPTRPENQHKCSLIDSAVRMVDALRQDTGSNYVAVCGGFARDAILGATPRDIDLYVSDDVFDKAYKFLYDTMLPEVSATVATSPEYTHQYIQRCVEAWACSAAKEAFLCLEDHKINLVGVHTEHMVNNTNLLIDMTWAQAVCSRFNLTTSQMYLNDHGEVRPLTYQVIRDVRNKECTILRTDWGRDGTAKAVAKFLAKYPDWKVFVCNDLGARYDYNEQKFLTPGGPCGRYDFDDEDYFI